VNVSVVTDAMVETMADCCGASVRGPMATTRVSKVTATAFISTFLAGRRISPLRKNLRNRPIGQEP
jgi:hypothetical protein